MPFFKTPSYMEKKKEMRAETIKNIVENKPYYHDSSTSSSKLAEPSKSTTSNKSSETLVEPTTNDNDTNTDSGERSKEQLSALERIKLEREYEKAHPKKPLKPAEGIWKSRLMVIPTAVLYGFGGG
jgi:hypothetical protein